MIRVNDAADFLINLFKNEEEGITNLKLQKLLYYAQGISFQRTGEALFDDELEAWDKGPVVYDVWKRFASYDRDPIRNSSGVRFETDTERLLLDVALMYGKYTSAKLVSMTHEEGSPWEQVYVQGDRRKVIPKELIKNYFLNEIQTLEPFEIEKCLSRSDQKTIKRDTIIPLSEWNYD